MTFWQENYPFIKDVYNMRQQKMLEWMENVEKAISRIMADKVYTSAEFKRERDNFHVSQFSNLVVDIFISKITFAGTLQRSLPRGSQEMAEGNVRNSHGRKSKGRKKRTDKQTRWSD